MAAAGISLLHDRKCSFNILYLGYLREVEKKNFRDLLVSQVARYRPLTKVSRGEEEYPDSAAHQHPHSTAAPSPLL